MGLYKLSKFWFWLACLSEDNENNRWQKYPFQGSQEPNTILREIKAGLGWHGDQWVNK